LVNSSLGSEEALHPGDEGSAMLLNLFLICRAVGSAYKRYVVGASGWPFDSLPFDDALAGQVLAGPHPYHIVEGSPSIAAPDRSEILEPDWGNH
jgi:hypothetical protein